MGARWPTPARALEDGRRCSPASDAPTTAEERVRWSAQRLRARAVAAAGGGGGSALPAEMVAAAEAEAASAPPRSRTRSRAGSVATAPSMGGSVLLREGGAEDFIAAEMRALLAARRLARGTAKASFMTTSTRAGRPLAARARALHRRRLPEAVPARRTCESASSTRDKTRPRRAAPALRRGELELRRRLAASLAALPTAAGGVDGLASPRR